jgi:hypothetical protein
MRGLGREPNEGQEHTDLDVINFRRLDDLRERLLNLTTANKLLNTKFTDRARGQFRIIDAAPDQIFEAIQKTELEFRPMPDLEDELPDEKTPEFQAALDEALIGDEEYREELERIEERDQEDAAEQQERALRALKDRLRERLGLPPRQGRRKPSLADHAKAHGINPSYDLPLCGQTQNERHKVGFLQLLMLPDMMERKLSGLNELARGYEQETGISTLFMAFGFLEWKEEDASDKKCRAPLLVLPVTLKRTLSNHRYVHKIRATEAYPQTNATLRELLRRNFKLELPELDENETPEGYWHRVADVVASKFSGWRVRPWIAVGVFQFARMALYHDLDRSKWDITSLSLVRDMLGGVDGGDISVGYAPVYDVDQPEIEAEAPYLIMDADSSQHRAVIDVMRGQSLVIKGPPGTGKSQTITNIIGAALARGEKVLFIADKLAALQVVQKRLKAAGLQPFCLPLHSDQVTRKAVIESLMQRAEFTAQRPAADINRRISALREKKETLNQCGHSQRQRRASSSPGPRAQSGARRRPSPTSIRRDVGAQPAQQVPKIVLHDRLRLAFGFDRGLVVGDAAPDSCDLRVLAVERMARMALCHDHGRQIEADRCSGIARLAVFAFAGKGRDPRANGLGRGRARLATVRRAPRLELLPSAGVGLPRAFGARLRLIALLSVL